MSKKKKCAKEGAKVIVGMAPKKMTTKEKKRLSKTLWESTQIIEDPNELDDSWDDYDSEKEEM